MSAPPSDPTTTTSATTTEPPSAGHAAGDAHGHHEHSPYLLHHFDDLEQQETTVNLGMWLFLVTEVLFFGGIFAAYAVYRFKYPTSFILGSAHLDVVIGTLNTIVLLVSSLTMALAVHAIQTGRVRHCVHYLIATVVLGGVFLGVKGFEYYHKYEESLIPGTQFNQANVVEGYELKLEGKEPQEFSADSDVAKNSQLFFSFYFAMTGLHALHMIIGAPLILITAWQTHKGAFSEEYYATVENMGLYWHFVDIVWVFLFPALYLIDRFAIVGGH